MSIAHKYNQQRREWIERETTWRRAVQPARLAKPVIKLKLPPKEPKK